MNYEFSTVPTIKLFNQLIGRFYLTKTKSLHPRFFDPRGVGHATFSACAGR